MENWYAFCLAIVTEISADDAVAYILYGHKLKNQKTARRVTNEEAIKMKELRDKGMKWIDIGRQFSVSEGAARKSVKRLA